MVDMATILREKIYSAVRAFTCATVAEAEAATKVIIRLVDNALPELSLMMGHAFDAALRHATKLVYVRRVVTRTHVASGDHDSKSVPICA